MQFTIATYIFKFCRLTLETTNAWNTSLVLLSVFCEKGTKSFKLRYLLYGNKGISFQNMEIFYENIRLEDKKARTRMKNFTSILVNLLKTF